MGTYNEEKPPEKQQFPPAVASKTIRYLQQHGGVPLDHPRRCTAHTHAGTPCRRYAARGANVCRVHGGAAPQVVAKARERLALAADTMAKTLLGIASGAESEAVKLAAVKDALDRAGVPAKAEVTVELKPWERLMCDIAGIAPITRDEHRTGLPALVEPAEVIDAEVIDPPALEGPGMRPDSPGDERTPDAAPDDADPIRHPLSGPPTVEPTQQLMTLEEAVTETTKTRVRRATMCLPQSR